MTLGLFLHHYLDLKLRIRESSAAVVSELVKVWDKARISISDRHNCQTKVEKLFEKWRLLKKNKGSQSVTQQANESDFIAIFDDLFDFAHAEALTTMTIDNDKQFLLLQRQKGRPGTMSGVENVLFGKEQRSKHRKQQTLSRQLRIEEEQSSHSASVIELESSASSSAEDDVDEYTDTISVSASSVWSLKRRWGRKTIITPQLASALNRTKVSDHKATFIVAETVQSMDEDIDDLALNR